MDKLVSRIFDVKLIYELFYAASGMENRELMTTGVGHRELGGLARSGCQSRRGAMRGPIESAHRATQNRQA